jgi:GNAT superfamily N-acetyltransferase
MKIREFKKGKYFLSNDKQKLQIELIHKFLSNSYWAQNIPIDIVQKSIDNSLSFGLYKGHDQIGFARIVTDFATFAYLADVFIIEEYRGQALAKWVMDVIMGLPELQGLRSWMLKTKDAHGLYEKYGFTKPRYPERVMEYSPLKNGYENLNYGKEG